MKLDKNLVPFLFPHLFLLAKFTSWIFQEGLARMEKKKKWDSMERKVALDNLEKFQDEARADRRGLWVHGDIESDDEDVVLPAKKAGGRR